jgi:hypothetical protein
MEWFAYLTLAFIGGFVSGRLWGFSSSKKALEDFKEDIHKYGPSKNW